MATTDCTAEVFVPPKKRTAAYIAPSRLLKSCCLRLLESTSLKICQMKRRKESTVYFKLEAYGLHLASLVPEYYSKYNSNNSCHKESDDIVLGIPPVRPVLFPETCLELSNGGLGVFGGKVQVLRFWCWVT